MRLPAVLLALALSLAGGAMAQTVGLSGMLGGKALVIVDGSAPKSVAAGESYKGVKVVSTQGDQAVVEIAGKKTTLRVGDAPANVGGGGGTDNAATKVVLTASSNGHFFTQGQINGRAAQLVVDTGASVVSMSTADAQRMGINYENGQRVQMSTANGVIPAWRIKLNTVRVGDVQMYDIDAVVSSGSMPYVLLGNSFLSRFQMTRTNDQMVLEKRF
jgi:aspartyl protease family protein